MLTYLIHLSVIEAFSLYFYDVRNKCELELLPKPNSGIIPRISLKSFKNQPNSANSAKLRLV